MVVASLTQNSMVIELNVAKGNNPLRLLKINYLVSYNTMLDIGYVEYNFSKILMI